MRLHSIASLIFMCLALTAAAATLEGENFVYNGAVSGGLQHGYGECRYANGDSYHGFWSKGLPDGLGRMLYADGTIQFGTWKRGAYQRPKGQRFVAGRQCYGIDVSRYQLTVDWERLTLPANASGEVLRRGAKTKYAQPVLFAVMKSTQGTTIIDPTFTRNFAEAKRCGIIRGAYHFLSIHSPAAAQAKYFIANTPLADGDLPPVLDLEIDKATMVKYHDKVVKMAREWLDAVERHYGVKPIVYTYQNYYTDYLHGHGLDGYDYWIARYGTEPTARRWEIWQFTDRGRATGINHAVDIDIFRGNYRDLQIYVQQKGIQRNHTLSRRPAILNRVGK